MILTGLLPTRTLSGMVSELIAMEALDLVQILLLLITLLTGLNLSLALLALGFATLACQGTIFLVLCHN